MARSRVHNVHGLRLMQSPALTLSYCVDEQPRHVSWTFLRPTWRAFSAINIVERSNLPSPRHRWGSYESYMLKEVIMGDV